MRGILEPEHLVFILLVVVLMFGGQKIPEVAAGLGRGVREFRKALDAPPDAPVRSIAEAPPVTIAEPPRDEAGPKRLLPGSDV